MRPEALVLLNGAAHGGRGLERFARTQAALKEACVPHVVHLRVDGAWEEAVRDALVAGTRMFVAAGGDGTVNALVNALQRHRGTTRLDELWLGAIGLGSSNDYHKPVETRVEGVPVRLNAADARPRDLIQCTWDSQDTVVVVSASVGITAAANAFFNEGDGPMRYLKRRSTGAAILWAALRTIVRFRSLAGEIQVDERRYRFRFNNVSVAKTPWLSGTFRYDTPAAPDDGRLAVNVLEGRSRVGALIALVSLARGRFVRLRGAHHHSAGRVHLALDQVADLELDGEVVRARDIHFQLLPQRIMACA